MSEFPDTVIYDVIVAGGGPDGCTAGTASALSLRCGGVVRNISITELQKNLKIIIAYYNKRRGISPI